MVTVERLLKCQEETKNRLSGLRKQLIHEENQTLQDKPQINDNYVLKSPRTPIHLRETTEQPYDDTIRNIRNNDPQRYINHMDQCTFSPRINRSRSAKGYERNVDDLINWGQEKRFKQTSTRLNNMMKEEATFSPILNSNSRSMVGDREGEVHQRLLESGVSRDKKLKKKIKEEEKLLFSPMIGHKSRELAEGLKNQMLVKLDNGQTQNLDFFYAIPNGAS